MAAAWGAATWRSLHEQMRDIGEHWAGDIAAGRRKVIEAYTPLLAAQPHDGWSAMRDIGYGAHPRQRLDVYCPADSEGAAPVVIFVHGGGFVRGNMNVNAEIYGNVPRYFARQGCVGVNVEYRLAPEATFPEGARDVAAAVQWVRSHIAELGGDPARILLIGHSAGGSHVASYLCDPRVRPATPEVAGAVLISARLRADVLPDNPNADGVRAYYGDDAARHEADAPMAHAAAMSVPVMVVVAEYENPHLDTYGLEFCHRMAEARKRAPHFVSMRGHNHTSVVAHFDSGEDRLGREIMQFLHDLSPSP